ncbi:MAG: TolC family protein, partial [Bacteroidaceae bacterium]|nr:TolC family protein [Bacteroidaceae bacterium]
SKGRVRIAKANLDVVKTQIEQNDIEYEQTIKKLVMQFNLQYEQCRDAARAEEIADERYALSVQRFEAGSISVTELNTAQQEKESARAQYISQLRTYWSNYYNIQRHTLWNYIENHEITTDFDRITR